MSRTALVILLGTVLSASVRPAGAQNARYTYADVGYVGDYAQLNENGTVLVRRAGNIYTGPASQDVVVPAGHTYRNGGAINNSGLVVYEGAAGSATGPVVGIYTRGERGNIIPPGGPQPQPIATTANYDFFTFGTTVPVINDNGMVVFYARAKGGSSEGLYTGPNPATDALAVRGTLANPTQFQSVNHDFTSLNNNGVVAFLAQQQAGPWGIFTASRGTSPSTIATDVGPFSLFASPAVNNAGRVAFYGETDSGVKGIFRGPDPVADVVAVQSDAPGAAYFSVVGYPDIGGGDTVVFNARRANGAHGVYTGADPLTDRVLAIGDSLFGSTVTSASFRRGGINELGQIAVSYRLADGRSGVVIATPVPEPATVVLAACLVGTGLLRRRAR